MPRRYAYLVSVTDVVTTRARLTQWHSNPDQLISRCQAGEHPCITFRNVEECKEKLEEGGAAQVEIGIDCD